LINCNGGVSDQLGLTERYRARTRLGTLNRVCEACSPRGPIAVGVQTNPVWGREGVLLESLHTGPLQPWYTTGLDDVEKGTLHTKTGFIFWSAVKYGIILEFFPN